MPQKIGYQCKSDAKAIGMAMEMFVNVLVLVAVPVLVTWGAYVLQQGRIKLTVGFIQHLTGRNARIAGLIAIFEGLAGISFVLGHHNSALWMMALTVPLMAAILFTEFNEQFA